MKKVQVLITCVTLLLIPYLLLKASGYIGNQNEQNEIHNKLKDTVYYVLKEESYGIRFVSMEEYLVGLTAANAPISYADEMLKAQIVLMRSSIVRHADEVRREPYGNEKYVYAKEEELGLAYYDDKDMKRLWGDKYVENYNRIATLVSATKGIYVSYGNKAVEAAFFPLSGGKTRGDVEGCDYLCPVVCENDIYADEFVHRITYDSAEFAAIFRKILKIDISDEQDISFEDFEVVSRDEGGYVTKVRVGEFYIPGEDIRLALLLPSANYELEFTLTGVTFIVYGKGHGFGMSQYEANVMAMNGSDYQDIINYFFYNTVIKKIE